MATDEIKVSIAETLSYIFYYIKTTPNLKITGSCTQIKELPKNLISVHGLKELSEIKRKENYIETGAAVTLGKLILQGKSKLPSFFSQALTSIGTPQIRNIATIGGNICASPVRGTLYAPLLALDARLVLQNENETKVIPISKLSSINSDSYILTKIRIPTDEWAIEEFHRLGESHRLTEQSYSYVFLANVENDVLTRIRLAFSGLGSARFTNLENKIIGTRLPLTEKIITNLLKDASAEYEKYFSASIVKAEFLRLATYSLKKLS